MSECSNLKKDANVTKGIAPIFLLVSLRLSFLFFSTSCRGKEMTFCPVSSVDRVAFSK